MDKLRILRGFTIVELLVVIVVLGVLVGVTVVAYNSTQTRGKTTAVANGIKDIERQLKALASKQGRGNWWTNPELVAGSSTTANVPLSHASLSSSINLPSSTGGLNLSWSYRYGTAGDRTAPATVPCAINPLGVVLVIDGVNRDIIRGLNEQLDTDSATDTTLVYGKICTPNTATYTTLYYQLGNNRSSFKAG